MCKVFIFNLFHLSTAYSEIVVWKIVGGWLSSLHNLTLFWIISIPLHSLASVWLYSWGCTQMFWKIFLIGTILLRCWVNIVNACVRCLLFVCLFIGDFLHVKATFSCYKIAFFYVTLTFYPLLKKERIFS